MKPSAADDLPLVVDTTLKLNDQFYLIDYLKSESTTTLRPSLIEKPSVNHKDCDPKILS